jgi:ABC-type sugar transport system ATPase subunit
MAAFVEFRNISKSFGGVLALNNVSLEIHKGQCHALMGENGAGKSTLGKVLAGIHRPDMGQVLIEGRAVRLSSPTDAAAAGIGMVHQELAFCPDLSIAENLALGRYPTRGGMVSRSLMARRARELLAQVGERSLDVTRPLRELSTAQEQVVQIAAAIGTGARILVFDEPTSSLSEREAQQLFGLIGELKQRGVTMIYVSHRMPEVFRLCDAISVLRDGRYVGTLTLGAAEKSWPADTQDRVVQMMIGRPVSDYLPQHTDGRTGEVLLEVKGLSSPGKFSDVSFEVRTGEIVGFAGLVGAGRSEVARAIFGLDGRATGSVRIDGKPLALGQIREAMRRGVGLVPEDRKRQGLVLMMGGRQNISLSLLQRLSRVGFLRRGEEKKITADYFARLRVKASSLTAPVSSMSGGNQQKVAIAKWLARGGRVLIVDEPTRGVDIGAKAAIHKLLDELAKSGVAVVVISSDLPEVLAISSRVLVMREGRIVGELSPAEATQENAMRLMAGVVENSRRPPPTSKPAA